MFRTISIKIEFSKLHQCFSLRAHTLTHTHTHTSIHTHTNTILDSAITFPRFWDTATINIALKQNDKEKEKTTNTVENKKCLKGCDPSPLSLNSIYVVWLREKNHRWVGVKSFWFQGTIPISKQEDAKSSHLEKVITIRFVSTTCSFLHSMCKMIIFLSKNAQRAWNCHAKLTHWTWKPLDPRVLQMQTQGSQGS